MSGQSLVPKSTTARRLRLFKFTALILGLSAAVLVVEVGVRLLIPGYMPSGIRERELFCRFDRELGWAPLENVTGILLSQGHSGLVHQNQFGIRGADDLELRKRSGKRRLLVLGDSYAWGYGVGQNELFSSPLVHGTDVEILNFGVSGYGTDQEYLLYLRKGASFEVDEVVVALTPYNDIDNNLHAEQYGYVKPYFELEGGQLVLHNDHIHERRLRSAGGWLRRNSRTWNLLGDGTRIIRNALEQDRNEKGTAKARDSLYGPENVSKRDREGVELTVAILKSLRDAASARKSEFSVIFIPYKPHIDRRAPANHPLVPLIAAELARAGITYREPYPEFLKAAQEGARLFNDPDNHFGPEGHALFAKFLTGGDVSKGAINYYMHQ